jgi:hypothetical protein
MSGRLGGVKVVILPNQNHVEGDPANSHTHILFFQDGSATSPRPAERAPAEPRERSRKAAAPHGGPIDDDPVPF